MEILISPSLLSANFVDLKTDITMINESSADWFHLDIMDGVFVPNITFGFPVIQQIKKLAMKPLDVHLMIVQPERYIEQFKTAGADVLTVHVEACTHLHRTVQQIKDAGMKAGVALNPHTSLSSVEEILEYTDMVLLMSVNPGFGGQKFIPSVLDKAKRLSEMIKNTKRDIILQIDGGVGIDNAKTIVESGVNCLVAGNAVFGANDPKSVISKLKNIV